MVRPFLEGGMTKRRTPCHYIGLGVITAALTGVPQHSAAHPTDVARDIGGEAAKPQSLNASRARVLSTLLDMSPSEKRARYGERVPQPRLPAQIIAATGETYDCRSTPTNGCGQCGATWNCPKPPKPKAFFSHPPPHPRKTR
jgi:hypothetical protein